ncbi:MAG: SDR family NAD(P)-dependent oxidoreductase [Myxococcota bacterium]
MAKPHMCSPETLARDLSGKIYVVTGANSGIGTITAGQLVKQGAHVIMGCRRVEEGEEVAKSFDTGRGGTTTVLRLDLGELASVREFAEQASTVHGGTLHGLVNNAGVMNTPQGKTKDGFETQIGVNHLGHYLLTELLLEALEQGAPSRVVNVSSCYHDKAMGREGRIDLEDLHFENRKYDGWTSYAQSKLANLLHAKSLAERCKDSGITAVSVHPGWVRTRLARNTMPLWVQDFVMRPVLSLIGMIEPWEGSQTTLHALLAKDVEEHNGEFYSQLGIYREKSSNRGGWPMRSPNPHAHDMETARALDTLSRQLVGLADAQAQAS